MTLKAVFPLLRRVLATVAALLLVSAPARAHEGGDTPAGHSLFGEAYDEGPRQAAVLMEGMPKLDFPVTTANPEAQRFIVQGVGQLHGFWYFEAERSFRQAVKLDPECVMAFWGMAMANVHNEKRAREFLKAAEASAGRARISRREQLYLEALTGFHGDEKSGDGDRPERHREYIRGLEQIIEEFPGDAEAKTFLAFKLWENAGRNKIPSYTAVDALAREVLAGNPLHPVQHARIHLWNGEADRRALDAAARCGQGSPGIAHMWHMPGHPYSSLHRYADAAWQQEASARVDHAYMMRTHVLPDQIHNYAHNNEWLVRNLNHLGRVREAVALAKNMVELPRHPKFNSLLKPSAGAGAYVDSTVTANTRRQNSAVQGRLRLLETLVRWELWEELLALGDTMYLDATELPEEQTERFRALGLAHFSKGDSAGGKRQMKALEDVLKQQREARQTAADEAEAKAQKEGKPEDQIAKAMTDALRAKAEPVRDAEKALAELRLFEALAADDKEKAKEMASDLKGVSKDRLAQIWLRLDDKEKAVNLAKEAAEEAKNQVQPLAVYVDILARCGKREEAVKTFTELRTVASLADPDTPVLRRLKPLEAELQLPEDWRTPFVPATDTGVRPPLDSLGPFRWQPSPAPEWSLSNTDNETISLTDFQGRPVLVLFYLGHACRHCMEQLNAFVPVASSFAESGVSVVAVSTDSVEGLRKTFRESNTAGEAPEPFPFPVLSDAALEVFKKYRAFDDFENIPLHGAFLVDGAGLVRWQDIGFEPFTDVDFLLKESQRLLQLPANPAVANTGNPEPSGS